MSIPASDKSNLTTKQQRFVEEYCVDWNCTQAAIRAGYSEDTAYSQGSRLLKNVEVRAAIDSRLRDLSLSAGQTTKLISEIAETRLNDFLRVKTVPTRERKEAYANVLLAQVKEEIELIEGKARSMKKKDAGALRSMVNKLRKREVELELEVLRFGPTAMVYAEGPLVLKEVPELDMVALAKAKEDGRIKSWTPTEFGIKIEMYDAAAALRDMGRIHGIFEKDNNQSKSVAVVNATVTVEQTGVPLAKSEKEVDDV